MLRILGPIVWVCVSGCSLALDVDDVPAPSDGEPGACVSDVDCDGGRACLRGACVAPDGACVSDADCADGLFCNGVETCVPGSDSADSNGCLAGVAPALTDGIDCTEDICDEVAGEVRHIRGADCICTTPQDDAACAAAAQQRGLTCVTASCNDQLGCEFAQAEPGAACGGAQGCVTGQCDDEGQCQPVRDDSACDDDDECNGAETCNPDGSCARGRDVDTDDGIACTADSCTGGRIVHDPASCDCQEPGIGCDCVGDGCDTLGACGGYTCSDRFTCGAADVAFREAGTLCDDGVPCTFDDVCDGSGACGGQLDHNLCSNFDLCDGEEICSPDAPQRDANGCIDGTAPNIDDGIPCTVDSCTDGEIRHDVGECAPCDNDEECMPGDGGNPCLRYFCGDICMAEPREQGTRCDDGLACTMGDMCDANQNCVPQTDTCECQVDADCVEDDNNRCVDPGACVDGACEYTFAVADTPCGDANCAAGSVCDGAGVCDVILDHDVCAGSCRRNPQCAPDDADADGDGCVYAPADEGACVVNCGHGDLNGLCTAGICLTPAEGPTGDASCADEVDNDCDGFTDDNDSDCITPGSVAVGGDDGGGVGRPLTLTVEAGEATNQGANLYCVGRLETWFEGFGDPATIADLGEGDGELAPLGNLGADVASGVSHDGALGLKVCNGKGLLLGPFVQPPLSDGTALMLRIRMKNMVPTGLGEEELFVVSYRNALTGNDGEDLFLPVVALDSADVVMRDYQNVFFNAQGVGAITVRLELLVRNGGTDPNRCAFVDSVGIYAVPWWRLDADAIPDEIDYLRWTWNNQSEDAVMYFEDPAQEADIAAFFFADRFPFEGHSITLEGRARHTGSLGLSWSHATMPGSILLPPVTQVPDGFDRSQPIRLDWAMALRNRAEWLGGDAMHAIYQVGDDEQTQHKIASALPPDIVGPYVTQYTAGGLRDGSHRVRHRFVAELTEEMKPVLGRRIGFVRPAPARIDPDAYIDDIDLYARDQSDYLTLAGTGPQDHDSTVHEVTLTSELSGRVHVQCYWQMPGTEDTPTIASRPHYVTITE